MPSFRVLLLLWILVSLLAIFLACRGSSAAVLPDALAADASSHAYAAAPAATAHSGASTPCQLPTGVPPAM